MENFLIIGASSGVGKGIADQLSALGHQVYAPYNFTQSITVALKEFAPDHLVLLGPGSSLGGSIGQILIQNKWHNLFSKADFAEKQKKDPFLLAMGLEEQRKILVSK